MTAETLREGVAAGTKSGDPVQARMLAIVDFLIRRQQPDGEFPTLRQFPGAVPAYVGATEFPNWFSFGSCPFATANMAFHLRELPFAGLERVCERACDSLARGMENGVARYVPAVAKPIDFPADVDDTCLAGLALRANGRDPQVNLDMVLSNVDGRGNIYTWLIPRPRHLWHPLNYRWLTNDRRTWLAAFQRYGISKPKLGHILREYVRASETPVVANVLLYTGVTRRTRRLLDTMIRRIEVDDVPQEYYANVIVTYFHVARLYRAGVDELDCLRDKIVSYLVKRQSPAGDIEGPFNTAIAALTLMYFGARDATLDRALQFLIGHEMHEKGWLPLHYCNDIDGVFVDGGAELTAAFFLEAMYRYTTKR